jgi:creatinine amidohydrolase
MAAMRKYNAVGSAWLGALTWEEAGRALERLPAVIPVGGAAVEHGPHLPYDTDRVITTALADAVAERVPVLVAPPIDFVYAPEVAGEGGTLSLGPETFIGLVSDIIRSLARHDARHIVLIERGPGLTAPLNIVSREMHEELGITVAVATSEGLAHEVRAECWPTRSGSTLASWRRR